MEARRSKAAPPSLAPRRDEVQSLYKRADPVEQYKRSLEKNGILQQLREVRPAELWLWLGLGQAHYSTSVLER